MNLKRYLPFVAICLWIVILGFFWYFYIAQNIDVEQVIFGSKKYILENLLLGICIFISLYVVRPLFFVMATPFDIFAGMVFGPVWGFIIAGVSVFFSCMFSYGFGRVTGVEIIKKKKKHSRLGKKLHTDTFYTALMMRFLFLPYDLSNYICGILKIPFFQYIGGSTLGVLPVTFVFVSAGSAFYGEDVTSYETLITSINYQNLWFASGFFITILVVAKLLKRKYKNINI